MVQCKSGWVSDMRQRFLLIALLAIGSALPFIGNARAGDCGNCGHVAYYGYVAQPKLVVRHPPVILYPYYISEYIPCGNGYVVNQGQYHTKAPLIAEPRCGYPVLSARD
jgi:hypothetical protein